MVRSTTAMTHFLLRPSIEVDSDLAKIEATRLAYGAAAAQRMALALGVPIPPEHIKDLPSVVEGGRPPIPVLGSVRLDH